jgi:hypothetical protein
MNPLSVTCVTVSLALCLCAGSAARAERPIVVRETTGTVEVRGWEKGLLKGNPNMKHWHWNPIYANPQGLRRIRPGSAPSAKEYRFTKSGQRAAVKRYITANHIPLPSSRDAEGRTIANKDLQGSWSAKSLSANLVNKDGKARLIAAKQGDYSVQDDGDNFAEPKVLSYGDYGKHANHQSTESAHRSRNSSIETKVYGSINKRDF